MLLPFQQRIIADLSAPKSDALLIAARGLGLRTIICELLRFYALSPTCLILILNATEEEERGLGEESGMRLRAIGHEMPARERQEAYKRGGILSVTSRILVVDMLNKVIPVEAITGLLVLHAESVTPTSLDAFIVRVYRKTNKEGFLKAFSDEPEHFTFGLAPLQTTLTQLKIRSVFIWPRFHVEVQEDLRKRKADVVELHQPLTPAMDEIQTAVLECMEATLNEIKRSSTMIEVEELTIENALFAAFDTIVRSRLESHWHKVGPRTRSLVADLTTLRKLLNYLLSFDCVAFNQFLETILSANSTNPLTGAQKQHKSPWLFLPAADTIFTIARKRVYLKADEKPKPPAEAKEAGGHEDTEQWAANAEDEEALRAAEALEDQAHLNGTTGTSAQTNGGNKRSSAPTQRNGTQRYPDWCPPGCVPVLEEQPKWQLLSDVLNEIEEDLHFNPVDMGAVANDTVLIMCNSGGTCSAIRRYLSTKDASEDGQGGRIELRRRLRDYFFWKAALGRLARNLKVQGQSSEKMIEEPFESAALKNKRAYQRGAQPMNKRRRIRGGAAATTSQPKTTTRENGIDASALEAEAAEVADLIPTLPGGREAPHSIDNDAMPDVFDELAYDEYFGICATEDLVVIRPFQDDEDDRVLEELRPKYVVMFDADPAFIRRIEVYRSSHPGLNVRVYFLMYSNSVEEQRYLSSIRREKDAFERLIRERGVNDVMVIPLQAERRAGDDSNEELLRTISSRIGGTRATAVVPKIIIDVREFRSSLPSLLHAAEFEVIPLTLTIGDYVLSPTMCVERKSVPDLIQSFNSGRLYQQCELMSVHYKQPILLIEFDAKRSFSLETYMDAAKPATSANAADVDLHSKLVLLTLCFPRLRIIWSSSPYATADIFADLKANHDEPDAETAGLVGAEDAAAASAAGDAGSGRIEGAINQAPQELLRSLPGITSKNARYIAQHVRNMEELCQLDSAEVEALIGVEAGRQLVRFLNNDARQA